MVRLCNVSHVADDWIVEVTAEGWVKTVLAAILDPVLAPKSKI